MTHRLNHEQARRRQQTTRPASREPAWWIVFARKGSHCAHCGNETYGQPAAFEGGSQTLVCKVCWERAQLHPQPSKAYLRALQSEARRKPSKGRKARRRRKRSRETGPQ